jgi:hypothetical protein
MDVFGNSIDNTHIGDVLITEDLDIEGSLDVGGGIVITGDVEVNNADVKGTLDVTLATHLLDTLEVDGITTLNAELKCGVVTSTTSVTAPIITGSTQVNTPLISDATEIKLSIAGNERMSVTATNLDLGETISLSTKNGVDVKTATSSSSSWLNYRTYGFMMTVGASNITLTQMGLETSLYNGYGANIKLSLWRASDMALLETITIAITDPVVNGAYMLPTLSSHILTAGANYAITANLLGVGSTFEIYNFNGGQQPYDSDIANLQTARGPDSVTDTPLYPSILGGVSNSTFCCNFVYVSSLVGPTLSLTSDTATVTGLLSTETITPIVTDVESVGSASLRYLDSEIKTMNGEEVYFNATNDNRIWFPTTAGTNAGLIVQDWTSVPFSTYERNGTYTSGRIKNSVLMNTENCLPNVTNVNSVGSSGLRYLDSEIKTMNTEQVTFNGGDSVNKIVFPAPTTTGFYGLGFFDSVGLPYMRMSQTVGIPNGRVAMATQLTAIGGTVALPSIAFASGLDGFYSGGGDINMAIAGIDNLSLTNAVNYSVPTLYNLQGRYGSSGVPTLSNIFTMTDSKVATGTTLLTDYSLISSTYEGFPSIPANSVKAGDNLRIHLTGVMDWVNNDTATFFVKLGGTKVIATPSVVFPAIAGEGWHIDASFTFRTDSSASVVVACAIEFHYNDTAAIKQGREFSQTFTISTVPLVGIGVGVNFDQSEVLNIVTATSATFDYVARS